MPTAEHREPYELRGSRTVLGAPGGEIPPGDSTIAAVKRTCAATLYVVSVCLNRIGTLQSFPDLYRKSIIRGRRYQGAGHRR